VTIRAFGAPMRARIQDGILDAFCHALDWSLATRGLQRWLGVRLESLVLMVTAVMSFAAMGLITRVGRGGVLPFTVGKRQAQWEDVNCWAGDVIRSNEAHHAAGLGRGQTREAGVNRL
jgi:hypothetical protein